MSTQKLRLGLRGTTAVLVVLCSPLTAAGSETIQETTVKAAQETETPEDPWEPFRLLEGTWEAGIDGKLGTGRGVRRYEFILDDLYLLARHASVRLPQEKSPEGDYHRELAVYSLDRDRGVIVLRDFKVEGFVLVYACEVEPKRFVCATERVENGEGWRARLTVEIRDRYRFHETFELASPGKDLQVYFTNRWTRIPDLAD